LSKNGHAEHADKPWDFMALYFQVNPKDAVLGFACFGRGQKQKLGYGQ
jgi:hypothetical protein